jgi:hypothetical protein
MKPQFSHELLSSFALWIDDVLIRKNEAVETGKSQEFFYSDADPDLPSNLVAYYSSDRQFSPINAPSGVYISGNFVAQNTQVGPLIDFDKGRVLFDSSTGDSLSISGNFDRKEFNIYLTPEDEEWVVLNKEFNIAGQSFLETVTGEGFARYTIPAAFIVNQDTTNEPFALGGEKSTESTIRLVLFSTNNYQHEGIKSALADQEEKCFDVFPFEDYPFAEFNSLKSFPYSYTGFITENTPSYKAYVEEVKVYNLADVINKKIGLSPNIKIGFADFSISTYRGTIS